MMHERPMPCSWDAHPTGVHDFLRIGALPMPSRNAHSTARPAPALKGPRGPRIAAAVRTTASQALDALLLRRRKESMERGSALTRGGDEDGARVEQGYRTAIDECRMQLRKYRGLERLPDPATLALTQGDASWATGIERAYAEARTAWDEAVREATAPGRGEQEGSGG
jgi:hypothetical protein